MPQRRIRHPQASSEHAYLINPICRAHLMGFVSLPDGMVKQPPHRRLQHLAMQLLIEPPPSDRQTTQVRSKAEECLP